MRLTTKRLLLRDFEAEDWRAVQEYAADPEAVRYRPFGPCTDDETQAVIQESARQIHLTHRTLYDLAIILADSNQLIGGCDIGLRRDDVSEASLGYGLSRTYWGQSYATEAVRALLAFGFAELGVERISADAEPANHASVRVLEKAGMRCVGQERQWIKGTERIVLHYIIARTDTSECR